MSSWCRLLGQYSTKISSQLKLNFSRTTSYCKLLKFRTSKQLQQWILLKAPPAPRQNGKTSKIVGSKSQDTLSHPYHAPQVRKTPNICNTIAPTSRTTLCSRRTDLICTRRWIRMIMMSATMVVVEVFSLEEVKIISTIRPLWRTGNSPVASTGDAPRKGIKSILYTTKSRWQLFRSNREQLFRRRLICPTTMPVSIQLKIWWEVVSFSINSAIANTLINISTNLGSTVEMKHRVAGINVLEWVRDLHACNTTLNKKLASSYR